MHFERGAFFVVLRGHRPRSHAHEPTSKVRSLNAAHTQATRNYFQKSAMPSESVFLLTLMQASFQRAAEKLFQ